MKIASQYLFYPHFFSEFIYCIFDFILIFIFSVLFFKIHIFLFLLFSLSLISSFSSFLFIFMHTMLFFFSFFLYAFFLVFANLQKYFGTFHILKLEDQFNGQIIKIKAKIEGHRKSWPSNINILIF